MIADAARHALAFMEATRRRAEHDVSIRRAARLAAQIEETER